VLVGMTNGAASKALLKLSSPALSADSSALTFQARTRMSRHRRASVISMLLLSVHAVVILVLKI